jgi:hypothetical protein
MKKSIKLFTLIGIILFSGLAFQSSAQILSNDSKWQFGAALAHGNKVDAFGLHLRPAYMLFDQLHIVPSTTLFFGSQIGNLKRNVSSFNIDGNYVIKSDDTLFQPYFLGGLNFSRERIKNDSDNTVMKRTRRGVNIGAGVDLRLLKRFAPFAEARYTIGGYGQFEVMAGLKI